MNKKKLQPGYCLKTNGGDCHLVLKVLGEVFVQDSFDGHWSTQSRNSSKEQAVMVWDGKFANKRSLSECDKAYCEILTPNDDEIIKVLKKINNNYKN